MVVTTTKNGLNISNTSLTLWCEQWQEDWGFRLLSLLFFLLIRGGRKIELTLIASDPDSGHYYCQPFSLAEARQASAMKSWPKLIRVLLQISDFRVLFQKILICVWEEGWMMFFLRIQFYWSLRNAWTELVHSLGIFWKSGFSSTY